MARSLHLNPLAMSYEEDRTLQRPPAADPTSWNGISYDDMMRSLEDALPADDRPTLVGQLPTRPAGFEPVAVTQRVPQVGHRLPHLETLASIPPVVMPSNAPADPDRERLRDRKLEHKRGRALAVLASTATESKPRKRNVKGFVIGALVGALIGVVGFTYAHPDARALASATATDARMHASWWMSNATAKSEPAAKPAAAAPVVAPPPAVLAPVIAAPVVATPVIAAPAEVPTMRAPAPPPARPARSAKAKRADSADAKTPAVDPDPTSLLDRGLGE
jgi:hypothetical protein